MHHSYDLYPARDLAIEDQIPLDWKVAQSWPDVWPCLAELGVFRQQRKMLMEASYELRGGGSAALCDIAPDVEQVFLSFACQAIACHQLSSSLVEPSW